MPAVKKISIEKGSGILTETNKSHQNDPFVLKQVAAANEFLNRPGMQEQLKKLAKKYEEKSE
ncbi:MAG: hypothetical protein ACHQIM_01680 [Sphingobacteriales bacterium]